MPISTDYVELQKLKERRDVVRSRIALCKANLSKNLQITSPTLMDLLKEEKRLNELIDEFVPHDFTPNPGGSTPAPAQALHASSCA